MRTAATSKKSQNRMLHKRQMPRKIRREVQPPALPPVRRGAGDEVGDGDEVSELHQLRRDGRRPVQFLGFLIEQKEAVEGAFEADVGGGAARCRWFLR